MLSAPPLLRHAPEPAAPRPAGRHRLRVGRLAVDVVTRDGALAAVAALVAARRGGTVFTPNVDHVVLVERDAALRRAYGRVSLALADGAPVVWASHLLGRPLPEKISGSDFVLPLARLAAARGWRLYLLGGAPGVADEAARRLTEATGVVVAGTDDAAVPSAPDAAVDAAICERVRRARADIVLVALGSPKQELWIDRAADALRPAVVMGVGASLDFIAGRVRRAPAFVSAAGLEWLFRLAQEPRRLWRRYLVRDPAFVWIVARAMRRRRAASG